MKIARQLCLILCCAMLAACAASTQPPVDTTTRTIPLVEARVAYGSSQSRYAQLENAEVHFIDEGQGPVVLLIHGTLGDVYDWDGWADALRDHYRVIRLDLPGFGLSGDIANGNYSIDRTIGLIDEFMDERGVPRFVIAGISYGGIIAFRYAATRTQRTRGLILVNSAGIQTGKRVRPNNASNTAPPRNIFVDDIVLYEDIEAFYSNYINDARMRTAGFLGRKLDYLNIEGRAEAAKRALALYERGDPVRVLGHVIAPSLVLWGLGNKALDTSTADAFVTALDNSESVALVTFDGGGHYINVERPAETALAAKAWLDRTVTTR